MKVRLSLEALDVTSFSVTPEPVIVVGDTDSGDEVQITPTITLTTIAITTVISDP